LVSRYRETAIRGNKIRIEQENVFWAINSPDEISSQYNQRERGPNPNLDCVNGYSSFEVPADEIAVPMELIQSAGDDPAKFDAVFESLDVVISTLWRVTCPTEGLICETIIRMMSWTAEGGLSREEKNDNEERGCFYDK
jgi:hypothetical protein